MTITRNFSVLANGAGSANNLSLGGATLGTNALAVSGHLLLEGVTSTGATGTGNLVFSASPTFSGTVTGPDAGTWDSSKLNVTGYIQTAAEYRGRAVSITGGSGAQSLGTGYGSGLCVVSGTSGGNIFIDQVAWFQFGVSTVVSASNNGSPATRTYSALGGGLTLSLSGSSVYYISVINLRGST